MWETRAKWLSCGGSQPVALLPADEWWQYFASLSNSKTEASHQAVTVPGPLARIRDCPLQSGITLPLTLIPNSIAYSLVTKALTAFFFFFFLRAVCVLAPWQLPDSCTCPFSPSKPDAFLIPWLLVFLFLSSTLVEAVIVQTNCKPILLCVNM